MGFWAKMNTLSWRRSAIIDNNRTHDTDYSAPCVFSRLTVKLATVYVHNRTFKDFTLARIVAVIELKHLGRFAAKLRVEGFSRVKSYAEKTAFRVADLGFCGVHVCLGE